MIDLVERDRALLGGLTVRLEASNGQLIECLLSPCDQLRIADLALRAHALRAPATTLVRAIGLNPGRRK